MMELPSEEKPQTQNPGLRYNLHLKLKGRNRYLMSRLRRLFLSDRFFFITCSLSRQRALLGEEDFICLSDSIQSARQVHGFLMTAWVILPDHWHAIFCPRHPLTLSRVMKVIKVKSTRQINTARQESGPLWQARFFDHALRTVEKYHRCVEYIHHNPVRRGLVQEPEEWPWSSIHSYRGSISPVLSINKVTMPTDPQARLH
jgi:putative transposase